MDYLSKKREYTFLNNHNAVIHVHTFQIAHASYKIFVEAKSKKYRDSVNLLEKIIPSLNIENLPTFVVVDNKKLGEGSISSYNAQQDVIYFNSKYANRDLLQNILNNPFFAANSLRGVIYHELAYKQHWDAVKRFYKAHKLRYNSIIDAKKKLDSNLEQYIGYQLSFDRSYLSKNVSIYAEKAYKCAKQHLQANMINEVIAEALTRNNSADKQLNKLVKEELSYGRLLNDGHSSSSNQE